MGCINSKIEEDKHSLENMNINNTNKFTLEGTSCYVRVVDVYDGDTITIVFRFGNKFYNKKCRIYGIDTPEIKTKNIEEKKEGNKAKEFLTNLVLGKVIWCAFEKEDKYGRLLATLWLDKDANESIDKIMIRAGFGYEYYGKTKKEFVSNVLNYHH
jgi:micrococcal nuclease